MTEYGSVEAAVLPRAASEAPRAILPQPSAHRHLQRPQPPACCLLVSFAQPLSDRCGRSAGHRDVLRAAGQLSRAAGAPTARACATT